MMVLRTICFKADLTTLIDWSSSIAWEILKAKWMIRYPAIAMPLFHPEEAWTRSTLFPDMLKACEYVLVNTAYEKTFVESLDPGRQDVYVVGVGVDPQKLAPQNGEATRLRYELGSAPIVGYIGRIALNKGVANLIRAMQLVWREKPSTRLVLAGYKPARESTGVLDVSAVIDSLSEEERAQLVTIYDFAESDKESIIDAFDVFAMPSVGESFGIAYLEAWLGRKPVVGSRIGTTACVVENGIDGLLVNPDDIDALARTLLTLLGNPELRRTMGDAGYRKVRSRYTWDVITDEIEKIYKRIRPACSLVYASG
jgi:glycosyltransferase involved in cell wall biosynthesis